jgi:hypothetical protein
MPEPVIVPEHEHPRTLDLRRAPPAKSPPRLG